MIGCTLDMLLMHYAAGSLEAAEALIAATHLALSPTARKKVSHYEAVGGCLMETMPEAKISDKCLETVLAFIDAPAVVTKEKACDARTSCNKRLALPDIVYDLLNDHCEEFSLAWSAADGGMEFVDLRVTASKPCHSKVQLVYLPPRVVMPDHSHEGLEITVVINGSFRDAYGHYRAGDIVIINDPALQHAPETLEEGCLCLTLIDGDLRLKTA